MADPRLAVIAVGGNALTLANENGDLDEQFAHARGIAAGVRDLLARGCRVLLTHGNGPQVGLAMRRARLARAADPSLPPTRLDECVAETQGSLGYILATALADAMAADPRRHEPVTTVITRVLVSRDDPAFTTPTKPIGLGSHRDLVPSPKPLRALELDAVSALLRAGHVVIAGGGGGIPVSRDAQGRYRGVEAVIDKDYTSALFAAELDADLLASCTSVERVAIDYGTPAQRDLDVLDAHDAERLLGEGQFAPGSMRPKIEAALQFLRAAPERPRTVLITTPELLTEGLAGRAGTRVFAKSGVTVREA